MRVLIGQIMLLVPFIAMLTIVIIAYYKPVCMPTETNYDHWQGCTTCKNYTLADGTRWDNEGRLQTLSEMVAREDTTTEAFAAASALAVVGIAYVVEQVASIITSRKALCTALRASLFVAASGMMGLTVWSMRVHGLLHSTFTALTIIVLLAQLGMCFVALRLTKPAEIKSWWWVTLASLVPLAALCTYVVKYAQSKSNSWPGTGVKCDEYFDASNYEHAVAQCTFIVVYYVEMSGVSYMAETRIRKNEAAAAAEAEAAAAEAAKTEEQAAEGSSLLTGSSEDGRPLLRRHGCTVVQF